VSKGGAVNIFAGMPKDATLSLNLSRTHYDEIAILGTFGFGPPQFRKALDILSSGVLPIAGFLTRTVALENIEEALKAASHYEGIKTLVVAQNV
jgi:L-iditol 2-dehydrogenase